MECHNVPVQQFTVFVFFCVLYSCATYGLIGLQHVWFFVRLDMGSLICLADLTGS